MTTKNIQDVVAERLGYLKDFPVSPDPDCTVSVYEEVIDVFTQLVKEVEAGERETLRVHIEREVIDPLIDTSKRNFTTDEAVERLRDMLRVTTPPTSNVTEK